MCTKTVYNKSRYSPTLTKMSLLLQGLLTNCISQPKAELDKNMNKKQKQKQRKNKTKQNKNKQNRYKIY